MSVDLTQLAMAIVSLASIVITSVLIPWMKSKMTTEHWNTFKSIAVDAVQAMEIIYRGSGQGAIKKQKAKEFIEKECAARNIKVNMDMIEVAIENAWMQLGMSHDMKAF